MSILNFANEANRAPATGNTTQTRPNATVWLNVGFQTDTGDFINLPVGIPLDTMEPANAGNSQSPEWIKTTAARNALLKALQAEGDALERGAARIIPQLSVQIRSTAKAMEIDPKDNELIAQMPTFGVAAE